MLSLLLTLAIFLFWVTTGYAILAACRRTQPLPNLLLAPVVGMAVLALPAFFLSRLGLPVLRFAWPLTLVLLALAGGVLWLLRGRIGVRGYGPFAAVLLLGLLLTGRAALSFGFDWLSYCNDDMSNYCLIAQRLVEHGFYDVPREAELLSGTDYTQFWWFYHVPDMCRSGTDLVLAWVISLTGLTPHQAFMPLILAFHLTLLSAGSLLVWTTEAQRRAALMTCALLAVSALTTLGATYQLIAQVAGLPMMAGCAFVMMEPPAPDRGGRIRQGLLIGLLCSGLMLYYPEIAPFLGLGYLLYLGLALWQRRLAWRPLLPVLGVALATSLVLLNTTFANPFVYCFQQARGGEGHTEQLVGLFPYYLLPTGLPTLWGLEPLCWGSGPLLTSVKIAVGGLLLLAALVAAVRLAWRLQPAALMTAVMLATGGVLFVQRGSFGLFKLAMFIQPFLLGTVVVGWFAVVRRPLLRLAPLLLLGLAGLPVQNLYVEASYGRTPVFTEIANPSASGLLRKFREEVAGTPVRRVLIDSPSYPLAKFLHFYLRGTPSTSPGVTSFQEYGLTVALNGREADPEKGWRSRLLPPGMRRAALDLQKALHALRDDGSFDLHDPAHPHAANRIQINNVGRPRAGEPGFSHLVASGPALTILNRFHFPEFETRPLRIVPWDRVSNHLVFVPSELGQHAFANHGDVTQIALHGMEPDYFFKGCNTAGCGRHILMEVLEPSKKVRLLLALSQSVRSDGVCRLPPAAAIGGERRLFGLTGRGGARVFSPPLEPQWVGGRPYVAIDMGAEGTLPRKERRGLMTLWGKDVPIDRRFLTCYARDISLVSEEEYARLEPPQLLAQFPDDLGRKGLEFSGFYEDGWISEAAWVMLSHPRGLANLVVVGDIPDFGEAPFTPELRLLVDGREVGRRTLKAGKRFDLRCAVPPGEGRRRVELRFSSVQQLPWPDGRPSAALIVKCGFEPVAAPTAPADRRRQ